MNAVKWLLWSALFCALLASRLPAQTLEWIEPSLVGLPSARCCGPAVYDAAMDATLLFGGEDSTTNYFNDTWEFSKTTGWKKLAPSVSPPPLTFASMAYDPTTETVVLFGGSLANNDNSDATWTWDGITWTQQFPPVSPPARGWNSNGMVFDSLIGKVVLFGGYTDEFDWFNDTWEWDGKTKTWTEQFPADSPSAREAPLAYDETSKQVVLFGGSTALGTAAGDTWTYNGVNWIQQQPGVVPPQRCDEAIAFDPILKSAVTFGGLSGPCEDCGGGRLNDTWLWNGAHWAQVQTSASPTARSGSSFDYDATMKGVLVFGGWISCCSFTSTNWFIEVSASVNTRLP
jgi:hypothetical protein